MTPLQSVLTVVPFIVICIIVSVKIITDMSVSFRFKALQWKEADLLRKKRSIEETEKELKRKEIDVNRILYREDNLAKKERELNLRKINFESEIRRKYLSLDLKESSLQKAQKELDEQFAALKNKTEILQNREDKIKELEKELNEKQKIINLMESALEWASNSYPPFAKAISEFLTMKHDAYAEFLRTKPHPALRAADILSKTKAESRAYIQKYHEIKYLLDSYETLFPWIIEYRDFDPEEIAKETPDVVTDDPVRKYISDAEYSKLSEEERNQMALERYIQSKKNNVQIGRLYERYIGYEYEIKGYDVSFFGAVKGFEDLGRDLIVRKGNKVTIIQCKCWSKEKTIHENTICQLYGTMIKYKIEHRGQHKIISAKLATSASCSDTALQFARELGIEIEQKPYRNFPMVKCNISKTGERIYHLPIDQNYDQIKIEPDKGEFYAETCQEAAKNKFRRAYRWNPSTP